MGTDYCVNTGPVVVIKNPPQPTNETHYSCCNPQCEKFHKYASQSDKFCHDCGSRLADWIEPVIKPLKVDFYQLLEEVLVPANYQNSDAVEIVLISNKNDKSKEVGFYHFNLKYNQFSVFPKIEDITGNIEKFKTIFARELTILKGIFGEANVEVRYGTVGTIS